MNSFNLERPRSLSELFDLLASAKGATRLLAGGTDLIVGLRHRSIAANTVIDLKRVAELRGKISVSNGMLVIPALVTMTELVRCNEAKRYFPALVDAANVVGSRQVRNRATLVGNICNASPAADTVPVLALFGAIVLVEGSQGVRPIPVRDFVQGNRVIDLGPDEVVTAVHIPIPARKSGSAFERITRRRGVDLATVNLSCRVEAGGGATFALGAVSARPILVENVDCTIDDDALKECMSVATPISDVRASANYRQAMLSVLARRALAKAKDQLKEGAIDG